MLIGALILALGITALEVPGAGAATSNNIGGGEANGGVIFASPGVPQLFASCRSVDFNLYGSSATFAINVQTGGGIGAALDGFAGTVTLNGVGHGYCENTTSGGGSLTITVPQARGANESTFSCDPSVPNGGTTLTGGYTRVSLDVEAILGGRCSVNGNDVPVMFVFRGEFYPTGGNGLSQPGISTPITNASFAGAIVVMPA